ncbi:MAG: ATP-binding cassette domain-containing protein [Candidatus Aminicenantes bacterium]|jgi:putative ABC transport system ATP-binding protein
MIQLEHVNVIKQDVVILKDINLTIEKGDKILLKGESGSGKSTLIKSLLYFEHFQGRILFNGEAITRKNLCLYRRQSGYISQTVPKFKENVREFLKIPYTFKSNKTLTFDSQKMLELLKKLNFVESILDKNFSELSGGEKQRLLILQMLMLNRPIYLLDEVTSALDKKNIQAAVSLITEDKSRTIVSISHNQEWEDLCSRVMEIDHGKIISDSASTKKGH